MSWIFVLLIKIYKNKQIIPDQKTKESCKSWRRHFMADKNLEQKQVIYGFTGTINLYSFAKFSPGSRYVPRFSIRQSKINRSQAQRLNS